MGFCLNLCDFLIFLFKAVSGVEVGYGVSMVGSGVARIFFQWGHSIHC